MTVSKWLCGFLLLLTISCESPSRDAAAPAAVMPIPPDKSTLAQSLLTAPQVAEGIVLSVDTEKKHLAEGAGVPNAGASLSDIAGAFGQTVRHFGAVTAIAPLTMILLNNDPSSVDLYDNMPPGDAFKLLASSLTDAQWGMLTTAQGIGLTDLDSQAQRTLFMDLFPGGTALVQPSVSYGHDATSDQTRDVTSELPQARLRFGRTVDLDLPAAGQPGTFIPGISDVSGGPVKYYFVNGDAGLSHAGGTASRAEVLNTPKQGDLDLTAPQFNVLIDVKGLRTVGDLVQRVGLMTHTELYADRRFEGRSLTISGPAASASAAGLLQAVAFCLTGTYRQVGAAYVLTDATVGNGTTHEIWRAFLRETDAARRGPVSEAAHRIGADRLSQLDDFSDPLALTAAQKQLAAGQQNNSSLSGLILPFDQLSPGQQSEARYRVEKDSEAATQGPTKGVPLVPSLSGSFWLREQPTLELVVPSLDGPIELSAASGSLSDLFRLSGPGGAPPNRASGQRDAAGPKLSKILQDHSQSPILIRPRTVADVDAAIADVKKIGMSCLWVEVVPAPNPAAGSGVNPTSAHADLIAEALRAAQGTGIHVYAVIDLLEWGPMTESSLRDRTILGEDSAQAATHRWQVRQEQTGQDMPPPAQDTIFVDPFTEEVRHSVVTLVQALAASPGLAGIVLRDTAAPGYGPAADAVVGAGQFGYSPAGRLAFLRREHADPLDVFAVPPVPSRVDLALPNFDDAARDSELSKEWDQFRTATDLALLKSLWAESVLSATRSGVPISTGVFVEQREGDHVPSWYGSWDGPASLPPMFRSPWQFDPQGNATGLKEDVVQAKQRSRVAYCSVVITAEANGDALALALNKIMQKPWDGFVLDCTSVLGNRRAQQTRVDLLAHLVDLTNAQGKTE
jgi:hypothetical protein